MCIFSPSILRNTNAIIERRTTIAPCHRRTKHHPIENQIRLRKNKYLSFQFLIKKTKCRPFTSPCQPHQVYFSPFDHKMKFSTFSFISLVTLAPTAFGFSTALFPQSTTTPQQTFPTKDQKEEIELPNFDELFGRIKQVSPLARITLDGGMESKRGFDAIHACKFLQINLTLIISCDTFLTFYLFSIQLHQI